MSGPFAGSNRGSSALLVIDVQNDFCAPQGALGVQNEDLTRVHVAAERIRDLLPAARAAGVPCVFVRVVHDDWLDAGAWGDRHRGTGRSRSSARKAVDGTWGAEFYLVQPEPGDLVLTKTRYSAFKGTPLRQILLGNTVRDVVLTGTQTDVCIIATALDAIQEGFGVTVIEDCVASTRPALHDAALDLIRLRAGEVVTLAQTVDDLRGEPLADPV